MVLTDFENTRESRFRQEVSEDGEPNDRLNCKLLYMLIYCGLCIFKCCNIQPYCLHPVTVTVYLFDTFHQ